jgi:hypothetical protein
MRGATPADWIDLLLVILNSGKVYNSQETAMVNTPPRIFRILRNPDPMAGQAALESRPEERR